MPEEGALQVSQVLMQGAEILRHADIPDPMRDARKLMAARLGIVADRLTLHIQDMIVADVANEFLTDIQARASRIPMSHLLGYREFWGRQFDVSRDVLDPRPETETLVAAALEISFTELLDLGTGSGCILLTLLAERPNARGIGTDLSEDALRVAKQNAKKFDLSGRAGFQKSDWFEDVSGAFDLIVSNPPYIASDEMSSLAPELSHEPQFALTDGADGLSAYREIAGKAGGYLRSGGWLLVEIGWKQGQEVAELLIQGGFAKVEILQDMDGRDRVVMGRWP